MSSQEAGRTAPTVLWKRADGGLTLAEHALAPGELELRTPTMSGRTALRGLPRQEALDLADAIRRYYGGDQAREERALLDAALALYRQGSRLNGSEIVADAKVIDAFTDAARALGGGSGE